MNYTNFRTEAKFDDWPYGRQLRTDCVFKIESNARGERVSRQTKNPKTGKLMNPKKSTYAKTSRIADGSDGKTYILQITRYGFISVTQSNLQFIEETIHPDNSRFAEIHATLIASE